jgi:DNA mismatch endonuclease, patch repair protein
MDRISKEKRSYNMSQIRSKDTKPEILVRKLAHKMGYRFRLHRNDLPGKPDLVFPRNKKIIFVHGCFWHVHSCINGQRIPENNRDYWLSKRTYNINRDKSHISELKKKGWKSLVVWECQTRDIQKLTNKLNRFLSS